MVLCWRRHGRAGGCRIKIKNQTKVFHINKLVLPVIRGNNGKLLFLMADKTVRCVQYNAPREQVRSVVCTHTIQMSLKALMKAGFQRTDKHICALYIENRILIKILKYQKFVKQTRDKQDIRGKNVTILELKNNNQPNAVTLDGEQRSLHLVKLIRAQGGCLGTKSRRKTW